MKMRVLHSSKAGFAQKIAEAISKDRKCNCDKIPPAYPVESEKLLMIGIDLGGRGPDQSVVDFCKNLTPQRAKNVAFFLTSHSGHTGVDSLKEILKGAGIHVVDTYECAVKGGLFSKGKLSDEDLDAAVVWAKRIVTSLTD